MIHLDATFWHRCRIHLVNRRDSGFVLCVCFDLLHRDILMTLLRHGTAIGSERYAIQEVQVVGLQCCICFPSSMVLMTTSAPCLMKT